MAALIEGIKIDGNLLKGAAEGINTMVQGIRTAITGKIDPAAAAELELKLTGLELTAAQMQTGINALEAQNPSKWVSGWRPAVGWVCAASLAFYYIPQAIMATVLWSIQSIMMMRTAPDITKVILPVYPIAFNAAEIVGLVASMLGLVASRTTERIKNVARL